ncbi:F-box/LRR-repeat protein 4-like [Oopsacas minuta]|uniref:F-box/LRR-repeat protein 4-like n=1 Tax=Oopsacas minuta TaxID=111878 RepID=A0AAV7KKT6_9METZ|nr:F-box/LRR-repeat protein 4-like [Oopsacas minuta]
MHGLFNYSTTSPVSIPGGGFVKEVLNYSSEYGRFQAYTVSNIVGEPRRYPKYGDFVSSMVLRTYGKWWKTAPMASKPFGVPHEGVESQDFLEVLFDKQVYPKEVRFYETYNPGCIVRIYACNSNHDGDFKTGEIRWALLWQGPPQSKECIAESRIFSPPLNKIDFPTNLIRVEFDCQYSDYYTELDGIALVGTEPSSKQTVEDRALGFTIENTCKLLKQVSIEQSAKKEEKVSPLSAAKEQDIDYFSRLPIETISKILIYLGLKDLCSIACTNTKFLYLAYDPLLYQEIDLQPFWVSLDDIALQSLQLRTQNLVKTSFSWTGAGGQISESVFHDFISNSGSNLEVLRLGCCRFITCETLQIISKTCTKLEELDLQACIHLKPSSFLPIKNLVKLKKLDLYRCSITDTILIEILANCAEIEYLNIGATVMTSMDAIAIQLGKTCHNLKAIDLWRSNITTKGLIALSDCKELLEVDIGWTKASKELHGIIHLVKCCVKLKKLFLTFCPVSNPELMNSIANNLHGLEQLDLLGSQSLSVESIENMFKKCQKLKFVDLSFCRHFTVEVVDTLRKSYTHIDIKRSFQD